MPEDAAIAIELLDQVLRLGPDYAAHQDLRNQGVC
jgi:hypothetical protein